MNSRVNQPKTSNPDAKYLGDAEVTLDKTGVPVDFILDPQLMDRMLTLAEENVSAGCFPYVAVLTHNGIILGEAANPVKLPDSAEDFPIFERPTADSVLKLCDLACDIAEQRFPSDRKAQAQFLDELVVYTNTEPSTQGSYAMANARMSKCFYSLDLKEEIEGSGGTVVPPVGTSEEVFNGSGLVPNFIGGLEVERALKAFSEGWAKANEGIALIGDTVFSSRKTIEDKALEAEQKFVDHVYSLTETNVKEGKLPYAAILVYKGDVIAEAACPVYTPKSAEDFPIIRKPTSDPFLSLAEDAYDQAKTRFPNDRKAQVEFLGELVIYSNSEPSNMGTIAIGFAQIINVIYSINHQQDLEISKGLVIPPVGTTEAVFTGANLKPNIISSIDLERSLALHKAAWEKIHAVS